jgi:hypothetical protein
METFLRIRSPLEKAFQDEAFQERCFKKNRFKTTDKQKTRECVEELVRQRRSEERYSRNAPWCNARS